MPFRGEMERAFGLDLSGVTAHVDRPAEMAAIGAHAATDGRSIAFASASPDRHVVAHEVAHVAQARRADGDGGLRGAGVDRRESESEEVDADVAADRVVAGLTPEIRATGRPGIHLLSDEELETLLDTVAGKNVGLRAFLKQKVEDHLGSFHPGRKDGKKTLGDLQKDEAEIMMRGWKHAYENQQIVLDFKDLLDEISEGNVRLRAHLENQIVVKVRLGHARTVDEARGVLINLRRVWRNEHPIWDEPEYRGTTNPDHLVDPPSGDNVIVGCHFDDKGLGNGILLALSRGDASALERLGVTMNGPWPVDSVEWGLFQFVGEERFFIVRGGAGMVQTNKHFAPKFVRNLTHTHPSTEKIKDTRTKHRMSKTSGAPVGFVLTKELEFLKSKEMGGLFNDLYKLFPSAHDLFTDEPGDLVMTPYRYDRETDVVYNPGPQTQNLPSLIFVTERHEQMGGHLKPMKTLLSIRASDRPNEVVWQGIVYSKAMKEKRAGTGGLVFDKELVGL